MNSDFLQKYGNIICIAVWIIEGMGAILYSLFSKRYPLSISILYIPFAFLGLFFLLKKKSGKREKDNYVLFVLFSTAMAYSIAIIIGGPFLMCMLYIMQWLLVIFYLDKNLCLELGAIQILGLFSLFVPQLILPDSFKAVSLAQLILAVISIGICGWIATNLIGILQSSQDNFLYQQQSTEDMLKVVEVICEENRLSTDEKTDFILNLSRMIKAPAKNIQNMGELIKRESDPERIEEYTKRLSKTGNDLSVMADEITSYIHLERSEVVLSERKYDFAILLESIIQGCLPSLKSKELELRINISKEIPRKLVGDSKALEIILMGLISNAIKYTDRGHIYLNIFVSKQKPGNNKIRLRIDVKDSGRGIRNKDQDKIFMPFFKSSEITDNADTSVGLGLYIARGFAELMGGDIYLLSDYGKGSSFFVEVLQGIDYKERDASTAYDYLEGALALAQMNTDISSEKTGEVEKESKNDSPVSLGAKETDSKKDGSDILPMIQGVDWSVALSFLPSKQILLATLEEMVKSGYDNAAILRHYYDNCKNSDKSELDDFKIKVHAIKGNLKMIGAAELSERARELEFAAKDQKRDIIFSKTEAFLNDYVELINNIGRIPEIAMKKQCTKRELDPDEVKRKMDELILALEDFDTDNADRIIAELEGYEYSKDVEKRVRTLSGLVLNLDLEGAKAEVDNIKKVL